MKEKQKANELIEKFKDFAHARWSDLSGYDKKDLLKNQIECALICVDEILNLQKSTGKWLPAVVPDSIKYWLEVKEEIIKLKK